MKKKFVKIFSFLMIVCLCFLCTGCFGIDSDFQLDLWEKLENGEITEEEFTQQMKDNLSVPMYGTKLLYRNSTNTNVSNTDYDDFFGKFSLWISNFLINVYGYYFSETITGLNMTLENSSYVYDSIRYQITEAHDISKVTETKFSQIENGEWIENTTEKETETQLFSIKADSSKAWNWSFGMETSPISSLIFLQNLYPAFDKKEELYLFDIAVADCLKTIESYYNNNTEDSNVTSKYLSTMLLNNNSSIDVLSASNDAEIIKNDWQADPVKAIEYLLYCYSLKTDPNEITINGQTVEIEGYSNITEARDHMKKVFEKQGSYIGFDEKYKQDLVDFILHYLIGEQALNQEFSYTSDATLNLVYDKDGNLDRYEIVDGKIEKTQVDRKYREVVEKIVDISYDNVLIGSVGGNNDENGGININQRYLNSQMQDLWGNNFFINAGFNGQESFNNKYIPAREYQSALMMFSENFSFDNIYVAVRYGGNNNLTKGYDTTQFIDIKVNLNLFLKGEWKQWGSEILRVPAGEFDASECELPNGFSQVAKFEGLEEKYRDSKYDNWGFSYENGITVGAFKPHIDGGILSESMNNYSGKVMVGEPIKLLGTTKVKDYYKIVESDENDKLSENQFYTSGIFNYEKLTGENLCDYVEISYEIIKTSGDFNTNYNFQTGIYLVM